MSYGFGIVGLGMIANFHAKAIKELNGGHLAACYSRSAEKAEAFAEQFGCRAYSDYDKFLADPDLKVVAIGTPSGAHLDPGVAAAKAGKHIVVEKPLEVTVEKCDQILAACQRSGVTCSTIFPSRFHDSARLLKQAVDQGRFGRVTMGDAYVKWYRTQAYYDSGAWRGTWELDGGGALMNQAIHSVDLLLWLMGPAVEVSAHTAMLAHERIEVEDVAVATVKFASGALGVIEATTAAFPGELKRIEISGSKGQAVLREEDITVWNFADKHADDDALLARMANRTQTGGGAGDPKAIGHHAHRLMFQDVVDAVKAGRQPQLGGSEGRKSVALISAIYEAARTGRTVAVPQG